MYAAAASCAHACHRARTQKHKDNDPTGVLDADEILQQIMINTAIDAVFSIGYRLRYFKFSKNDIDVNT